MLVQCRECGRSSRSRLERSSLLPPPPAPPPPVCPDPAHGSASAWSRQTTWPARKRLPERGPDAPHVVLSTKFREPWYTTISIGIKWVQTGSVCFVVGLSLSLSLPLSPSPARNSTGPRPTTGGCSPSQKLRQDPARQEGLRAPNSAGLLPGEAE